MQRFLFQAWEGHSQCMLPASSKPTGEIGLPFPHFAPRHLVPHACNPSPKHLLASCPQLTFQLSHLPSPPPSPLPFPLSSAPPYLSSLPLLSPSPSNLLTMDFLQGFKPDLASNFPSAGQASSPSLSPLPPSLCLSVGFSLWFSSVLLLPLFRDLKPRAEVMGEGRIFVRTPSPCLPFSKLAPFCLLEGEKKLLPSPPPSSFQQSINLAVPSLPPMELAVE